MPFKLTNNRCFAIRHALLAIIAGSVALTMTLPVYAQDVQSRLNRLENEIQTLSRAVFRGETPPQPPSFESTAGDSASRAGLEVRLSQMEIELRTLTGKIEEIEFQNRRLQEQIDQLQAAQQHPAPSAATQAPGQAGQVRGLLTGDGRVVSPAASPQETVQPLGTSLIGEPQETAPANDSTGTAQPAGGVLGTLGDHAANNPAAAYDQAFGLLQNRDYDAAAQAFRTFLNNHPDHELAANAHYWLGESYYVRNNFEQAARIFAEAYQKHPQGGKGPDNMLKLGMSLAGLGRTREACVTLAEIEKEYPTGAMSILMRAENEMNKLDCP